METFIYKAADVEKNVYKVLNELTDMNGELFPFNIGEPLPLDYAATDEAIQKVCALLNRILLAMKIQAAVLDSDLDNKALLAAKNAMLKAVLG